MAIKFAKNHAVRVGVVEDDPVTAGLIEAWLKRRGRVAIRLTSREAMAGGEALRGCGKVLVSPLPDQASTDRLIARLRAANPEAEIGLLVDPARTRLIEVPAGALPISVRLGADSLDGLAEFLNL